MNSLYKELAAIARGKMIVTTTVSDEVFAQQQEFIQNFAELIIDDVVKLIEQRQEGWDKWNNTARSSEATKSAKEECKVLIYEINNRYGVDHAAV